MRASAIDEVGHFVRTQRAVLSAVRMRWGPTTPISVLLSEMPPRGNIEAAGESWEYVRHGGGVRFREWRSGRTIDVHDRVDDPEAFDLWRLRTYFGSLGQSGIRVLERSLQSRGVSLDHALTTLLERWQASGDVVEAEGVFRLARPSLGCS